ncbi:MAG: hypothetical protein LBQ81_08665 [Zoogloeaceae bacterium]|jgi:hypothetical protein|nr:hypothetical protein [Zoogloeaceae bacterium]
MNINDELPPPPTPQQARALIQLALDHCEELSETAILLGASIRASKLYLERALAGIDVLLEEDDE